MLTIRYTRRKNCWKISYSKALFGTSTNEISKFDKRDEIKRFLNWWNTNNPHNIILMPDVDYFFKDDMPRVTQEEAEKLGLGKSTSAVSTTVATPNIRVEGSGKRRSVSTPFGIFTKVKDAVAAMKENGVKNAEQFFYRQTKIEGSGYKYLD